MVNSLENIDKSKVYASRIEGLDKAVADEVENSTDNITITSNISTNKIQTVGIINQNSGSPALKSWSGTSSQYNSILSKDANTLYNITDDSDVSLAILETLYPVGSIYITTNETCPLAVLISGSTWIKVSSGRVLQGADNDHGAGTTIEAGLPNITGESQINAAVGTDYTGAFYKSDDKTIGSYSNTGTAPSLSFNASLSNPIYGNSDTVQPPAYFVNIFRRTL